MEMLPEEKNLLEEIRATSVEIDDIEELMHMDQNDKAYDGRAVIAKMNVDDNPTTPGKFGIRAIPTLIVFKNGEAVDQVTGAVGKAQLKAMIDKIL